MDRLLSSLSHFNQTLAIASGSLIVELDGRSTWGANYLFKKYKYKAVRHMPLNRAMIIPVQCQYYLAMGNFGKICYQVHQRYGNLQGEIHSHIKYSRNMLVIKDFCAAFNVEAGFILIWHKLNNLLDVYFDLNPLLEEIYQICIRPWIIKQSHTQLLF